MTNSDIQKLGELAKIEIRQEEIDGFKKDFDSILGYIKQIESVDLGDVNQDFLVKNIARKDEAKNEPGQFSNDLLSSAPNTENGFVKVKKIL